MKYVILILFKLYTTIVYTNFGPILNFSKNFSIVDWIINLKWTSSFHIFYGINEFLRSKIAMIVKKKKNQASLIILVLIV
jgi:hypothetical protein